MAEVDYVQLHLNLIQDQWFVALTIPVTEFPRFSCAYRRWLAYLGFTITACTGHLHTSFDSNSPPVDLDSLDPIDIYKDYYYHHEGDIYPIDPDLQNLSVSASTHGSGLCRGFREKIVTRDSTCVMTDVVQDYCDAAHLIHLSLGSNYIEQMTTKRQIGEDPIIDDINDQRNGILANAILHRGLRKKAAFLQVPNPFMRLQDMPDYSDEDNATGPKYYLHAFSSHPDVLGIPHNKCARLPHSLEDWPTHTILAYVYGSVALANFNPSPDCIHTLTEHWGSNYYSADVGSNRDGGYSQTEGQRTVNAEKKAQQAEERDQRHANWLGRRDLLQVNSKDWSAEEAQLAMGMIWGMIDESNTKKQKPEVQERRRAEELRREELNQGKVHKWLASVES